MFSPDEEHIKILDQKPLLAFDKNADFEKQKEQIKAKFTELLGDMPKKVEANFQLEYKKDNGSYTEYRFVFNSEEDTKVPCILCVPDTDKEKYPLVICLTGHGTGMHVLLDRRIFERDNIIKGDRSIALQVLERGYAALLIEQRGFGERRTMHDLPSEDKGAPRCRYTAMNALLVGRTIIGERIWDISRALDVVLEKFGMIDGEKIACTGNSGGGTASYYTACLDERIKVCMPSCSVCTYRDSIGDMLHCECNYIPKIAKYMDMGDLSVMIAPRTLLMVNGENDPIFPQKGVIKAYERVCEVYAAAGAPDRCSLKFGHGEHQYYKNEMWSGFDEKVGW